MLRGKIGLAALLALAVAMPQAAAPALGAEAEAGLTVYAGRGGLDVRLVARYASGAEPGEGGTEIVAYDAASKQAYSVNGFAKSLDIVDLSGLRTDMPGAAELPLKKRIPLENLAGTPLRLDDITSVALSPKGGLLAVAAPAEPVTDRGYVIFLDTEGRYVNHVQVGVLPDMVTFTPDGDRVLTADEGQPNADYTIDPPGSVSIIDVSGGAAALTQEHVTTVGFDGLDAEGIRIAKPGASFADDAEPEYIAVSPDSRTAYVALQENNAIATLDIAAAAFTSVKSLGTVDHSVPGHGFDASDKDGAASLNRWPALGLFMPDGLSLYAAGGKTYLLTANEGDARDYDGYSEEARVKDLQDRLALNAAHYAGYTQEQLDALAPTLTAEDRLGRLKTTTTGAGADGRYEAIYAYGTRSFTVWDADDLSMVYDSADDFEQMTKRALPSAFNFDNGENAFDSRSDDKGPEPESVVTGTVGDKTYAFVGLERISGMMAYDLTNPERPVFDTFFSSRDFSAEGETPAGDVAPEGLAFVPAEDSPAGRALLLAAHEVSGTIAVYELIPSAKKRITIIHTNDVHSRVFEDGGGMGYAKVGAIVDEYRTMNPNTLVLDGGDTTHGQTFSTLVRGSSIIDLMNEIGYDAMTSGNHDYNYGFPRLLELADRASFPILAANVKQADGSYVLPPYTIKEVAGLRIGIFGLATPETLYKTHPNNVAGLTFLPPTQAAAEMVRELEPQTDIIIAVAHLGTDGSTLPENRSDVIVSQVDGIDLFVDGHSHEVVSRMIGDTLLVQDGEYAEQVGIVTLIVEDGAIVEKTSEFITAADASSIAPHAAVERLISDTKASQQLVLDEVVGQSTVRLNGEREVVRTGESNLGNLIADAMLQASGAEMSLTNGGGIRASIESGDITKGDVITVLPFGNYIVTMKVTGAEIKEALEVGAAGYPSAHGAFSHVGGAAYRIDASKPAGERVHSITVQGAPLDPNREYLLATNDFMAAGGDQYTMLADNPVINHSAALDEAVIAYLQARGTVAAQAEGRIVAETAAAGTPSVPDAASGAAPSPAPTPVAAPSPAAVPAPAEVPSAPASQAPQPADAPTGYYIVKPGDNLSRIARAYGTVWQKLQELNRLPNPNLIFPDQKIIVPQK